MSDEKVDDDIPHKLPMVFRVSKVNSFYILYPDCERSKALLYLLRPKKYIDPDDLVEVSKMGFEWKILGKTEEVSGFRVKIRREGLKVREY